MPAIRIPNSEICMSLTQEERILLNVLGFLQYDP
jgi:hypothetical protein